ncbi:polysaccharide biosynthesis/export family protein [Mucilaginibacter sp. OK098]|uniref:polysaccharide biosynthesis/export family protein n=1 Tax=Mucilaginibacter sp. OK098 TaxID=1855297 RepID=UPI0009124920|nr:polysaccharide biosynthesis/export family protein [Mucilaginibacter sp. OK098]SHL92846.1 polysaccharide export outer membrane protein [Mucilaginibacter sp. OK098]
MKRNLSLNIFLFLAFIITITSCADQKKYIYFQKTNNQSDTLNVAKAYTPKIQPGDILSIPISSLSPAASSFFNPFSGSSGTSDNSSVAGGSGTTPGLAQSTATGFLVDDAGIIEVPIIGNVKVGGLTTSIARDTIKNRLKFYLKEPTVNVRFLNYKISVMGEVAHPSVYVIPNEKVTIPEALSMAGDLTIFGKRENILIIRDVDGKKEFGRVNLNNREVFTSPYYYLHSGDVVYVEQGKGKIAQSDNAYRILPIIISALTLISLFVLRLK